MTSVAEHVPFLHFCKMCQKISDGKGKEKKLKPLRDFVQYWREFHLKLHSNEPNSNDSFYPAIRLLIPHCERQRAAYGIKEFTLAKLIIEIFCLDKNGADAKKLLNYRSPKVASAEAGDFASVAYFVLKGRCPEQGTLTVYDINYYLDEIASNQANKNRDDVKQELLHLLRNTSALEQKWLIRIILKEMKLGIGENSVFKTFHDDARDLFNVTNNLEKVCTSLHDPNIRLHEIEISLFSPFRPMLGEIALPTQVENLMQNKSFFIETKYDGERLQLHKNGNSYMYFSRGGHDCTEVYGCSPLRGSLTPFIHSTFSSNVSSCILDGEIVIYSNQLNCIVSKGEHADVQAIAPDGDYGPCFCVFDILMLNGKVMTNIPLKDRVPQIRNVFTPIESKIRCTEQKSASNNNEVIEELNKAIDMRLEGIVVKNPDSVYKPNMRKGSGWLKVKPDYIDNLMDELDLLIMGGYYGEGRRSHIVSEFLLGVASDEKKDGEPAYFFSFCKVGSGYSDKELYELSGKLEKYWQQYNPKRPPKELIIGGGRKEQPDVWILPSKSQILQVKAAEINRSKSFATDCTLRFPRVEKIRYDKQWYQCMTKSEMETLRQRAQGHLATRNYVSEDMGEPSPKKQKIQRENLVKIAPHFRPTDVSDVQKVSELFQDKEFCIVTSLPQLKQNAEKQITQFDGTFVQNPGNKTFCVLTDKVTAKINNIIQTNAYDVVNIKWLNRCIENKVLLPWLPDELFHATDETQSKLSEQFDEFGDSFTEDVTVESLKKVFNSIPKENWESIKTSNERIAELEQEYFGDENIYSLFRICRIGIDFKNPKLQLTYCKCKLYGGDVCLEIDSRTTHVVILSSDSHLVNKLNKLAAKRKEGRFHLVTEKWILDCITKGRLLLERDYRPVDRSAQF